MYVVYFNKVIFQFNEYKTTMSMNQNIVFGDVNFHCGLLRMCNKESLLF